MSERIVWTCDGCSKELVVSDPRNRHDWRKVEIVLDGFNGYPLHSEADGLRKYHLCAPCRRKLYDVSNPMTWERSAEEAAE